MTPRADALRSALTPGRALAVLIGLGAALRLWQYAGNPGLWMDELAVAHNLATRSLALLLTAPLLDDQVAPPGFLLISRAVVVAFGSSEYALRLFPLLCSLASLPLFAWIARRVLSPAGAVLTVALFALSSGVALFAAEAKQYASDVLATLVLTELALRWLAGATPRRTLALAVAGVLALFFSQTAAFVLAGLAAALWVGVDRRERRALVVPVALWTAATALSVLYARARMSSGLMAYMHWFWRDGFMPRPIRGLDDLLWPGRALSNVFGLVLDYPWPTAYLVLAGWGLVSLLRRRRETALVLALPLLATLLAAAVRAYPFQLRVILFLVPALLLFVAEGTWRLAEVVRNRLLGSLVLMGVAAPVVVALVRNPPVWRLDEVRPMLAELQRRRQPGDAIYASYPTWQALRFYGPRYGLGLETVDLGACHPTDLHDYLRELDRYRGRRRVWFLTAFSGPVTLGETQRMIAYLDAIGGRTDLIEGPPSTRPGAIASRERLRVRPPTAAYLYDLSDPERLASTSADSRELPPAVQFVGVPRCAYGPVIPRVPTLEQPSGTPGAVRASGSR